MILHVHRRREDDQGEQFHYLTVLLEFMCRHPGSAFHLWTFYPTLKYEGIIDALFDHT